MISPFSGRSNKVLISRHIPLKPMKAAEMCFRFLRAVVVDPMVLLCTEGLRSWLHVGTVDTPQPLVTFVLGGPGHPCNESHPEDGQHLTCAIEMLLR